MKSGSRIPNCTALTFFTGADECVNLSMLANQLTISERCAEGVCRELCTLYSPAERDSLHHSTRSTARLTANADHARRSAATCLVGKSSVSANLLRLRELPEACPCARVVSIGLDTGRVYIGKQFLFKMPLSLVRHLTTLRIAPEVSIPRAYKSARTQAVVNSAH